MQAPSLPPPFTEDELAIFREAEELRAIIAHPGWKRIVTFMRDWSLEALAAMEKADLADDRRSLELLRTWKVREEVFRRIQDHVLERIAAADDVVAAMQSQNPLSSELIKEYLDVHGPTAGDPGSGPE